MQFYLPPARLFNNVEAIYLPLLPSCRATSHFDDDILVFYPVDGRKLGWPGWLIASYILRQYTRERSPILVLTGFDVEQLR